MSKLDIYHELARTYGAEIARIANAIYCGRSAAKRLRGLRARLLRGDRICCSASALPADALVINGVFCTPLALEHPDRHPCAFRYAHRGG